MPQTKHLLAPVELKDAEDGAGEVIARFSVFDIVDRDGDILRRSAFEDGQAVPMVWAHDWKTPIGKGVIKVKGDHAEFHGEFLSTEAAQQARTTVREMGGLQQWSFGFHILETQDNQQIRGLDITGAEVFEVSPVLVGANRATATLAVKGIEPEAKDMSQVMSMMGDLTAAELRRVRARCDELLSGMEASLQGDSEVAAIAEAVQWLTQVPEDEWPVRLRGLAALVEDALKALPESAEQLIEQERLALEALEIGEAA